MANFNNNFIVSGTITEGLKKLYTENGVDFYGTIVDSKQRDYYQIDGTKKKGRVHRLPLILPDKKEINLDRLTTGKEVYINGEVRSYPFSNHEKEGQKLYTFVNNIRSIMCDEEENMNFLRLNASLKDAPTFRLTPGNPSEKRAPSRICDLNLAVKRVDYDNQKLTQTVKREENDNQPIVLTEQTYDNIPAIAWEENAVKASTLPAGTKLRVFASLFRREYKKENENFYRTTYEASINKFHERY